MTIFPSLILLFLLSAHAFRPPLHSGVRPRTRLDARSDSLKFLLTGAKPKAPPAPVSIQDTVADSSINFAEPPVTALQPLANPESIGDSFFPDAVYTSAAENAAKATDAVQQQQAAGDIRNNLESIDTDVLLKNTVDRLVQSTKTGQEMAQNLRETFQSLAGDSESGDAPLLWDYVNNNLQKVQVPKLEPALKDAFAFPEVAFQETMKQFGEISTQPNWQVQQYLDVLNKDELKNWYWGAFFVLIAAGYLPALQNVRMFGNAAAPKLSALVNELNEMKLEKEIRDRDLDELRTDMKLFLENVQAGRVLEEKVADELKHAKTTNSAQLKQIEITQGENVSHV